MQSNLETNIPMCIRKFKPAEIVECGKANVGVAKQSVKQECNTKVTQMQPVEMRTKKEIETAVCDYFKVKKEEVYKAYKATYPVNGAKPILMYLLYKEGYKAYDIAAWFGFATTLIYRYCGEVQVALKSDTKIKEDVKAIQEKLNERVK